MSTKTDRPYRLDGNVDSEQAEHSSANPAAANIQVRILIELQVISMILREAYGVTEDLTRLRQDAADSIT